MAAGVVPVAAGVVPVAAGAVPVEMIQIVSAAVILGAVEPATVFNLFTGPEHMIYFK